MIVVINLIRENAPWIYGACALIALWYLRVAILARRERRFAVFALERETALNRTYRAWTAAIALGMVMGLVYLISNIVAEAVEPLAQEAPTPAPVVVTPARATPTLPLPEILPTETPTPRPRPTLRPQPTVGPVATPTPAVQSPRCGDPRAAITAPGINAVVSGMVPIFGTAVHERFQYYKLEYGAGANPSVWSYFDGGEHPVQNGRLGTLNAGALAPGVYAIRVVVVDRTGNFVDPPCQTVVVIR
ncbi:MAG: hypothetical protein N2439_07645 [Anaerolineae bacterium]|nr:hypothetical protein [Anaerolineae bacterium]